MNSIGNGARIYGGQPLMVPQKQQQQQQLQPPTSVYPSNNLYGSASTSTLTTNGSAAAVAAANRRLTVGDLGPMASSSSTFQPRKNVNSMYVTGSGATALGSNSNGNNSSNGSHNTHHHGTIGVANGAGYLRQMESQMAVDDMSMRSHRR